MIKQLLILFFISFLSFGQNNYMLDSNSDHSVLNQNMFGCEDLDETILSILSLFINDPGFGFFGCSDIIPYLESQVLIPLNCNTNLTPFGYFNMTVEDICECSCQEHLNLDNSIFIKREIINTISMIGQSANQLGFQLEIYNDGSVEKKYLVQ